MLVHGLCLLCTARALDSRHRSVLSYFQPIFRLCLNDLSVARQKLERLNEHERLADGVVLVSLAIEEVAHGAVPLCEDELVAALYVLVR